MTRPRGYADWNPRADSLVLLDDVRDVLDTYRAHLPLTVRQIFYRLVATTGYAKDEKAYARLCEMLVRARRGQAIPFDSIRDDGVAQLHYACYTDPAEFVAELVTRAEGYVRDKQVGQDRYVELWCEAEGMMPQLARVASRYSVPVYSAGGFLSVTATWEISQRIVAREQPTVLLHVGDYDPSGESIFTAISEDVSAFVYGHGGERPEPVRVALTPEQVRAHDLPTAPPKKSDSRSRGWTETCQCESLPPDVLADYVEGAILEWLDQDVIDDHTTGERVERRGLIDRLRTL